MNCLAAISTALNGLHHDIEMISSAVEEFQGIPGRMERIDVGQDFQVFVDFAHTPNALRQVLSATRKFTKNRIIAVFGSAGLRDKAKRRMMAEISAQLSDITILTAEDPRTESLDAILSQMTEGIKAFGGVEKKNFWKVADRREAIRLAVAMASTNDVVIVLGKGHEKSMCYGELEYPWDDCVAVKAALAERTGVVGPPMPFLPEVS